MRVRSPSIRGLSPCGGTLGLRHRPSLRAAASCCSACGECGTASAQLQLSPDAPVCGGGGRRAVGRVSLRCRYRIAGIPPRCGVSGIPQRRRRASGLYGAALPGGPECLGGDRFPAHPGGATYDRDASCAVRVQLRDLSGGVLPYPFACAAGCPRWNRCTAVAGYGGWASAKVAVAGDSLRPLGERIVTAVAAVVGIGFWGGLLLYGTWVELTLIFG